MADIYPGLQQYAGQQVDTGDKAKAYAAKTTLLQGESLRSMRLSAWG